MYFQITTRCNMRCSHCCYSCTETGEDMSREVFVKALHIARDERLSIDIAGGEPTLHSLFWDFIGLALGFGHDAIYVTTNGKNTRDAFRLATLARDGILDVDLSRDKYHDSIDQRVVDAFRSTYRDGRGISDKRGVRDVTMGGKLDPASAGRASDWANPLHNRCCGAQVSVVPDGTIYACGCFTKTYGTVDRPNIPSKKDREKCVEGLGDIAIVNGEAVRRFHEIVA